MKSALIKRRFCILLSFMLIANILMPVTAQAANKPKFNKTSATVCVGQTSKLKGYDLIAQCPGAKNGF
jgi:hypothetical protein